MDLSFKNLRLAGYDTDMYELNPMGVLRNCKSGRILKWLPTGNYLNFPLCINGDMSNVVQCHRLLAILFKPNPLGLPVVDHEDGDPKNNSLDNLRWVSHQQNSFNRKPTAVSGFKNIYIKNVRKYCYWRVGIMFDGKKVVDKCFPYNNEEEPPAEVIAFRDIELRRWHGDFARV